MPDFQEERRRCERHVQVRGTFLVNSEAFEIFWRGWWERSLADESAQIILSRAVEVRTVRLEAAHALEKEASAMEATAREMRKAVQKMNQVAAGEAAHPQEVKEGGQS